MLSTKRIARISLLAASAVATLCAAPASAQQIDDIIAIGDSYADTGNAFALGYSRPEAFLLYPSGRFSGGTNYIDSLADILGVPVYDYAIGGALAGVNNTTLCFDPPYGDTLCGKGLQYEIDQILNVGPQSSVFPTVDPAFDEHDLLTVSIGGNDARIFSTFGGTLQTAPLAGAATAAVASAQLDRLVANGTPTISFLAGDSGRLPESIALGPTEVAIRSAYSNAFNTAMQQTLAGYAANGSIVHYLDLGLVLDNIIANPSAYGITRGIVCPTLPSTACVNNSAGYLFYLDALHLTSDGFRIVAQYVATQLAAPLTLQAPADIGVDTAHQFGRTLQSRVGEVGLAGVTYPAGLTAFVAGDAWQAKHNETRGNDRFGNSAFGITGGVQYGFGAGAAGIALNYSRPKADFNNDATDVKTSSIQVGAFAGMGFGGGGYLKGQLGYGWDDHDIDRTGVVEGMDASPKGHHWTAGARLGYLLPMGAFQIGPAVALDYARAKVNGYTESGDPALTLNVSSQSYKSLRGSAGVEVMADLMGSDHLRPYLSAMVEKELSGNNRSIQFSQTSAPIIVNTFDFETPSKKAYGRFNLGGATTLSGNVALDAGLSLTVGRKYGNETSGQVALKVGF